jgi:hypothetical protein
MSATEESNNTNSRTQYHDNASFRESAYDFSNTSFGTASMLSFRSFSKFGYRSVSSDGFQLFNGSCSNSFSNLNYQKLIDKPWGELVEPYYECTYNSGLAFLNGVGKRL